jgi:hypothetical protein
LILKPGEHLPDMPYGFRRVTGGVRVLRLHFNARAYRKMQQYVAVLASAVTDNHRLAGKSLGHQRALFDSLDGDCYFVGHFCASAKTPFFSV